MPKPKAQRLLSHSARLCDIDSANGQGKHTAALLNAQAAYILVGWARHTHIT